MSLQTNGLQAVASSLLLAMAVPAVAQNAPTPKDYSGSYICKMTASGGVNFDAQTQKWFSTKFIVEDETYIIKVTNTGEFGETLGGKKQLYGIDVKEFGDDGNGYSCRVRGQAKWEDRTKIAIDEGRADCNFMAQYAFNFESMKMQIMYAGGYMSDGFSTDSSYVSVGKCQRID